MSQQVFVSRDGTVTPSLDRLQNGVPTWDEICEDESEPISSSGSPQHDPSLDSESIHLATLRAGSIAARAQQPQAALAQHRQRTTHGTSGGAPHQDVLPSGSTPKFEQAPADDEVFWLRTRDSAADQDVLPSGSTPKFEQARADDEAFSLQMTLPANATRFSLAAVFIPSDASLPCAIVDSTRKTATSQSIMGTRIPLKGTREAQLLPSMMALEKRFAVSPHPPHPHPPLEVAVREVAPLISIERTPENIDGLLCEPSREELYFVKKAVAKVDERQPLRPGVPFTLTGVCQSMNKINTAVLFVPDDPRIPGREAYTNRGNKIEGNNVMLQFEPFVREMCGEWEQLGRCKRKRAVEEGADGGRIAKRRCAMEGQDTVVQHSLLHTDDEDIWANGFFLEPERGA
ncbi:hypothetical protein B0H17DRAFT_632688 [Mycena rosella]|uniref:Uncharacterized protein n=1 Tax=Mycena rosella TaxID=1033263 RepID=A0AAD7DEF1_MYCRO|nr:hypothetical protein B0H17DRAFT_632688 [Mycena rosella]